MSQCREVDKRLCSYVRQGYFFPRIFVNIFTVQKSASAAIFASVFLIDKQTSCRVVQKKNSDLGIKYRQFYIWKVIRSPMPDYSQSGSPSHLLLKFLSIAQQETKLLPVVKGNTNNVKHSMHNMCLSWVCFQSIFSGSFIFGPNTFTQYPSRCIHTSKKTGLAGRKNPQKILIFRRKIVLKFCNVLEKANRHL